MPYHDQFAPRPHSRGRPGKGSNDASRAKGQKPPSQKTMLSNALQKANTAVQLDNAQNYEGAREAYAEACQLLQHVLQKTSGDEDKRKLEAIRRTYTSRIDELDQMGPWQRSDSKALPARPESDTNLHSSFRSVSEDGADDPQAIVETATLTRIVNDEGYGHQSPPPASSRSPELRLRETDPYQRDGLQAPRTFEAGLLQSSFSRSPARLRFNDHLDTQRPEPSLQPPSLSPYQSQSLSADYDYDDDHDDTVRPGSRRRQNSHDSALEASNMARVDSQNSWLDPIDESGGSSASSIHSHPSSFGYRTRHVRAPSGDTEAEFDTALDAAIEAAYDDGYEPSQSRRYESGPPDEEVVANALRKVELARERVRQTEREAYGVASDGGPNWQFQGLPHSRALDHEGPEDFFDDNSSEEEERILEEITREFAMEDTFSSHRPQQKQPIPRESDSSGVTTRTWPSSIGSTPATGTTSLSVVAEKPAQAPNTSGKAPSPVPPPLPPPTQLLPELPVQRPSSSGQSVRSRRLSGQNARQLKIETETSKLSQQQHDHPAGAQPHTKTASQDSTTHPPEAANAPGTKRRPSSPIAEASPAEPPHLGSPFGHRGAVEGDDAHAARSASPSLNKLRKNFSSSSLKSMKSRNPSLSNLDDTLETSPVTPSSSQFASMKAPAVPALPTPLTASFRDKIDPTSTGGLYLFEDSFHAPETPGTPNPVFPDAPVPLESCPSDFMLRPFWLMRCMYQTLVHPRGGYLSAKLFVPRDVWRVKGVKLKNIDDKIANCDLLTAALLKLAKVDTCDADAVLEEMQALESVLEQAQASLNRRLGNEVGVQGSGTLFKDASNAADVEPSSGVPRSSSVSHKSSSFSWRRLRSKNSAAGLGGAYNNRANGAETTKEPASLSSLPMTPNPTSRPAKRDLGQVQFVGPNANYAGSLARLFDAAQAVDDIARQVEDPGLRHADKTQVGLELCTRHAAEFFGFYICRFALADLGMLMDKFVKRGTEWVLA